MAVDATLAQTSDHLFSASIAAYSLGIMLFSGDYAFGKSARSRIGKKQPALVGSGAPAGAEPLDDTPVQTRPDEPNDSPPATDRSVFGTRAGLIGFVVTCIGLGLQIGSLALRGIAIGRLPWGNMFEFASVIAGVAAATYIVLLGRKPHLRFLGVFILPPVVLILVLAGLNLYTAAAPVVAALRSYWLAIHVSAASIATGIFLVSAVASILYLVRSKHDRAEAAAGHVLPSRVAGHLPSAESLDRLAARTVTFAFPIWTFAIICGAIWAESAWGRFWGWDPKETWSFVSWLVYAAYLHARATAGWKGTKAAWLNLLAAGTMIFNFVIVNIVVSGLHSYAGLS